MGSCFRFWARRNRPAPTAEKIVNENGMKRDDVDHLAEQRFGHGLTQLNKLEASGLIDELFQQVGRNGRNGRSQRQYTRRAA